MPWAKPPCSFDGPNFPVEEPPAGVRIVGAVAKPVYERGEPVEVSITLFNDSAEPVEVGTGTADGELLIHDGAGTYRSLGRGGSEPQYIDAEPVGPGESRRLEGTWDQLSCSNGAAAARQAPPGEYFVAGFFQGGPKTWPVWYASQASFVIG